MPPTRIVLLMDMAIARPTTTTTLPPSNDRVSTALLSTLRVIQAITQVDGKEEKNKDVHVTCRIFDSMAGFTHKDVAKKTCSATEWKLLTKEAWTEIKTVFTQACLVPTSSVPANTTIARTVIESVQIGADGAFRDVWNRSSYDDMVEIIMIVTPGPGRTRASASTFFGIEESSRYDGGGEEEGVARQIDLSQEFKTLQESIVIAHPTTPRRVVWIDMSLLCDTLQHETRECPYEDVLLDYTTCMNNDNVMYIPVERCMLAPECQQNVLPGRGEMLRGKGGIVFSDILHEFDLTGSLNDVMFLSHSLPHEPPPHDLMRDVHTPADFMLAYPRTRAGLHVIMELHRTGQCQHVYLQSNPSRHFLLVAHCEGVAALYARCFTATSPPTDACIAPTNVVPTQPHESTMCALELAMARWTRIPECVVPFPHAMLLDGGVPRNPNNTNTVKPRTRRGKVVMEDPAPSTTSLVPTAISATNDNPLPPPPPEQQQQQPPIPIAINDLTEITTSFAHHLITVPPSDICDTITSFLSSKSWETSSPQRDEFFKLLISKLDSTNTVDSKTALLVCLVWHKSLALQPTTRWNDKDMKKVKSLLTHLSISNSGDPTPFTLFLKNVLLPLCSPWDSLKNLVGKFLWDSDAPSPVPGKTQPVGMGKLMHPPPLPVLSSSSLKRISFTDAMYASPPATRMMRESQPQLPSLLGTTNAADVPKIKRAKTVSSMLIAPQNKSLLNHFSRALCNPEIEFKLRVKPRNMVPSAATTTTTMASPLEIVPTSTIRGGGMATTLPSTSTKFHFLAPSKTLVEETPELSASEASAAQAKFHGPLRKTMTVQEVRKRLF